ncbi:MAG TPA: hypothetical protein VM938_10970 [Acidimicrobiales bacterium]|nr:hypothetical protein [Acidimicrobiales bacterium]
MNDLLVRLVGQRDLPRALAAVTAAVLLVGVFTLGVRVGSSGDDDASPAPAPNETTTTAAAGPPDTTAATPAPPPPDVAALPAVPAVPSPNGVAAGARSVAYEGGISGIASVKLRGNQAIEFTGQFVDGAGTRRRGTVRGSGPEVHVAGKALDLTVVGELRIRGTTVHLTRGTIQVASSGNVTAAAGSFTFQPAFDPNAPRTTSSPQPTDVPGPVTLVSEPGVTAGISGGEAEWVDAPATLRATGKDRSTLSWAGPGVVRAAGRDHKGEFLGVKASALEVTIERLPGGVRLRGTATFLQVFADGLPTLPGQGRMRVKRTPGQVARGTNGSFTWAPENDGKTDFVMTRIKPGNAEAAWVSLGLDKLPAMCGGEECPVKGGDTTGFRSGRGINAVIRPGTGDERDIRFAVPADAALGRHQIVVVVEGNFEPIRVVVEFEVVATSPTTTR